MVAAACTAGCSWILGVSGDPEVQDVLPTPSDDAADGEAGDGAAGN